MAGNSVFNIAREESLKNGFFYHIEDGYHYHLSYEKGNSLYFKCVEYGSGCGGRAVFNNTGFNHTLDHAHPPDFLFCQVTELRRRIIERCKSLEYRSFSEIIEQECAAYPVEVSSQVTLAIMRKSMRETRLKNYPPAPATLRDLTALLQDDQYRVLTMTDDGQDNIYCGSVDDVDGSHHVLFTSQRLLDALSTEFSILHCDGTFKVFPVQFYDRHHTQLLTIVGTWNSHVVPLAWVLMEKKTEEAYNAVLDLLLHLIDNNFIANKIITDFEKPLQNSWRAKFRVRVQGCLFHYAQAIVHGAMRHNLAWHIQNDETVLWLVRLVCAIPLLPQRKMKRGLSLIMTEAHEGGYFGLMTPFFRYVNREWLRNRRKRSRLCMYMSEHRTNNASEAHHRALKQRMGVHPNIFVFIWRLVKLEMRTYRDLVGLQEGRRVGRRRKASAVANDIRLRRLYEALLRPPGLPDNALRRFLRAASQIMRNVVDDIIAQ